MWDAAESGGPTTAFHPIDFMLDQPMASLDEIVEATTSPFVTRTSTTASAGIRGEASPLMTLKCPFNGVFMTLNRRHIPQKTLYSLASSAYETTAR